MKLENEKKNKRSVVYAYSRACSNQASYVPLWPQLCSLRLLGCRVQGVQLV